jgi:hypothetical protein
MTASEASVRDSCLKVLAMEAVDGDEGLGSKGVARALSIEVVLSLETRAIVSWMLSMMCPSFPEVESAYTPAGYL